MSGTKLTFATAERTGWNWLVGGVSGLDLASRLGSGVQFFFLDTVKIVLLAGIIFLVTIARSSMSVERIRALRGGTRESIGNVLAASIGVVRRSARAAPFRRSSGSSPPASRWGHDELPDRRIQTGIEEVRSILRRIWPYLLVGVGLGAAIHGWAPEDFFATCGRAGQPVRRPDRCRRLYHRRRLPVQRHPVDFKREGTMTMNIKILGSGCANCVNLEKVAKQAAS